MLGQNAWSNIISRNRTAGHSRGMDFTMFNFHFTDLGTKIVDKLGLSYCSMQELNSMIDTELSGHSCFQCHVLDIGDEKLEFFCRDVLECI